MRRHWGTRRASIDGELLPGLQLPPQTALSRQNIRFFLSGAEAGACAMSAP